MRRVGWEVQFGIPIFRVYDELERLRGARMRKAGWEVHFGTPISESTMSWEGSKG